MTKKLMVGGFIGIELAMIGFLGNNLYRERIFLTASVAPLKKDTLVLPPAKTLSYFYELKPNSVVADNEPWLPDGVRQTINADGLNDRLAYTVEKSPGVFRIITMGDSFTYGMYVNTEENYSEKLEDMLNRNGRIKFEVINLGVAGYDLAYARELFRQKGNKYKPDLVLWLLNDGSRKVNDLMIPIVNACATQLKPLGQYSKATGDGRITYPCSLKAAQEVTKKMSEEEILQYQLNVIKNLDTELNHTPLVFLNFPNRDAKFSDRLIPYVKTKKQRYFYDQITTVDSSKDLSLPDGHPSQAGHSVMAKEILDYLLKKNIIPWASSVM